MNRGYVFDGHAAVSLCLIDGDRAILSGAMADEDPLAEVLEALDRSVEQALGLLKQLPFDALGSEQQGRALALEVVCLRRKGDSDGLEKRVTEVIAGSEDDEELMVAFGVELSDQDENEHAKAVFQRMRERQPQNPVPVFYLGVVLEREMVYSEALELYEKSIELHEEFAPGHCHRAACLRSMNRLTESADAYRRYLTLEPDDAQEWISLAIVESEREEYERAKVAYDKAESLDPENVSLHYNRAVTALRQGDAAGVAKSAEQLARIAPDDWRTVMASAYRVESDGDVNGGWLACEKGYGLARRSSDPHGIAMAAAAALGYANRHGLKGPAEELVEQVFRDQAFSPEVLVELRSLDGKEREEAGDWMVILEGDVTDPEVFEALSEDDPYGPPFRYFRNFRVYALDEKQAGQLAAEFERRCGAGSLRVDAVERIGDVTGVSLGVWMRDHVANTYSVNAPDE